MLITGEVPLDVLVGIESAAEERIEKVHNHHDHHHQQGHHHEHAHDHFDSYVITLGEVDMDLFQVQLKALLEKYDIYRAKGFAAIPGKPMRQVLQAVGKRLDVHFDCLWTVDEKRQTSLVIICKNVQEHVLRDALTAAVI